MTNEELAIRIKSNIDVADNMLLLWNQTKRFIHIIAKRFEGKAELEDLEQEGYLALYDAVDGYKPEKSVKFLTYAEHWINQRMARYIQNNGTIRIPVYEGEKVREYNKMMNAFRIYLGRKPTRHEIAYNMGIPFEQVAKLEKSAGMGQIGSLDVCLSEDTEGTLADIIPADECVEDEVLEEIKHDQLTAIIWPLVDALPGQQGVVLRQRFQENKSLKDTGESIGLTIERVRTIESKALRSMRCSRDAHLLRTFLTDDDIYRSALHGTGSGRFNQTWTSSTERVALELNEQ